MSIINIETIETRDEAEGDLAAAENLGLVTINHAAYGDIEIRYLADYDEFEVRFGDTDEVVVRGNDCAVLDVLVDLYEKE
jgi:hypothetical protein